MSTLTSPLFALYVLTIGRVRFCLSVLRPLAVGVGDGRLVERIDAAEHQASLTYEMEARWAQQRKVASSSRGRASRIDPAVDRLVTATVDTLQALVRSLGEAHPLRKLAQELLDHCFPGGAHAITSLSYDEELVMVEWLHKELAARSKDVAAVGIGVYLEALSAILPKYRAELEAMKPQGLSYDALLAARKATHARLLRVVARIVDEWGGDDQEETLYTLLTPIVFQNDRVGEYYRSRVAPKDVDPETGEETDEEPAEPAAVVATN